jgi:hypothetical protein
VREVRGKSGGGQRWATFVKNHTVSSSDRVFNPLIAAAAVLATSSFFRSFIESPLERTTRCGTTSPHSPTSRGSRSRRSPAAPRCCSAAVLRAS